MPYSILGNNFERAIANNAAFYDDRGGIEEAAGYLLWLGHRRIAFLGNTSLPWFQRRCEGYRQAMEKYGPTPIAISENWEVSNIEYGTLAIARLLREYDRPTAILAGNDEIAAGA